MGKKDRQRRARRTKRPPAVRTRGDEREAKKDPPRPWTLAVDVGGTGLKTILLDARGEPVTERTRVPTPRPATPVAILDGLEDLAREHSGFDRISIGFPGVVVDNEIRSAPNLDDGWHSYPLAKEVEKRLGKPARVLNDAAVQGLGAIEGVGLEMMITFGTGFGSALFVDGVAVPNLELGRHPFRDGETYEGWVGARVLKKLGKKKWRKRVEDVISTIAPVWNYRMLYIGGGNAKALRPEDLPPNVKVVSNTAGLLGGIALWKRR